MQNTYLKLQGSWENGIMYTTLKNFFGNKKKMKLKKEKNIYMLAKIYINTTIKWHFT